MPSYPPPNPDCSQLRRREIWRYIIVIKMVRRCLTFLLLCLWTAAAFGQSNTTELASEHWVEVRTPHFDTFSCGPIQEVNKLAGRLEQFCQAYALLAGAQSIASPPTIVTAFPDYESLKPFLPLYDGKPANLAGFFARGSDENLIVLALAYTNSASARSAGRLSRIRSLVASPQRSHLAGLAQGRDERDLFDL